MAEKNSSPQSDQENPNKREDVEGAHIDAAGAFTCGETTVCRRIARLVATSPVRMDTRRRLGRLHQQEAQQGTALFADVPQPLLASTGVLTRNQPHVRADLLAAFEPRRCSDDQHIGEGR